MPITYTNDIRNLRSQQLDGFFVGWPNHPSPCAHLEILQGSYAAWLALNEDRCVGFINALSDGVFYSYIPLLEVLPDYQGRGIGKELVKRMLEALGKMYAIDIVCDESVASFYRAMGMDKCVGMVTRNFANQGGRRD